MTLHVWLVRHAQSTWNAEHRLQGKADPPLTNLGCKQAAAIAQRLASVKPDAIYTSPLERAYVTAQAIGRPLGLRPIKDARLQEIGVGVASGKRWDEIIQRWPHLQRIAQRGDLVLPHIPGAESLESFNRRVTQSFADIQEAHTEGNVVVVSHGGVFRAYIGQLLGVHQGYTPSLRFSNASLSKVIFVEPGRIDVRYINDISHLRNGHREELG